MIQVPPRPLVIHVLRLPAGGWPGLRVVGAVVPHHNMHPHHHHQPGYLTHDQEERFVLATWRSLICFVAATQTYTQAFD